MQVTFYKTTDNKNVINKVLTNPLTINLNIKEDNPDYAPVLKMVTDVTGYNYCHIPFFNRFYFVDRVERKGQIILVGLSCDVLETYKDDILASNARFKRNLKNGDYMNFNIENSSLKTVDKVNGTVTLPTEKHYILTTIAEGKGV
jgi:hypothetical protein